MPIIHEKKSTTMNHIKEDEFSLLVSDYNKYTNYFNSIFKEINSKDYIKVLSLNKKDGMGVIKFKAPDVIPLKQLLKSKQNQLGYKQTETLFINLSKQMLNLEKDNYTNLLFNINDSLIKMYNDPIIWNQNNQITSDTISFKLISNKVEQMNLLKNSFIISKDSLGNFNQIKGRNMLATFSDENYLKTINVNGNGETIYFGLNEESNSILGLNYIVCSDLKLNFENNEINNIIFYKNPIAKMIPPHEIKEKDLYIKSFEWREEDKPKISDVVYYFRKKIYLRNDSKIKN